MKGGPLRFLIGVALLWAGLRGWMLWPAAAPGPAARQIAWARALPPEPEPQAAPAPRRAPPPGSNARLEPPPPAPVALAQAPATAVPAPPPAPAPMFTPAAPAPFPGLAPPAAAMASEGPALSAWLLARRGTGAPLAPGGQLAASQAGLRGTLPLARRAALAARLSGPIDGGPGLEAALGVDLRAGPVTLALERRIGLDRGGRDAVAATLFGGASAVKLPGRLRLDAWGQAGLVGLKRRDAFIDAAVRIERPLGPRLAAGAGLWGGAQPGAARLDIGPALSVRAGRLRIGAEWRQRIAGRARPGSGPALTLGADF